MNYRNTPTKVTLVAWCFALAAALPAQTYLVSPDGDDDDPDGPWETIAGLQGHLGLLGAGDSVLFERDTVYPGMINAFQVNGATGDPIVYGAYGTGSDPVIYGSELVQGTWTDHGGVWRILIPEDADVKDVFIGDEIQTLAREPDLGWWRNDTMGFDAVVLDTITLYYTHLIDSTGLVDPPLGGDWTGGEAVIREFNWQYRVVHIDSVATDRILFTSNGIDLKREDWGYFLRNKLGALDEAGEWYYDAAVDILYMRAPGNVDPNTLEVRVSVHKHGIYLDRSSHFVVQDLTFKHQWDAGIAAYGWGGQASDDLEVHDCDFVDVYDGISNLSAPGAFGKGHYYHDNSFLRAYNAGIQSIADSTEIANNTFRDIGMIPGEGKPGEYPSYSGVISFGDHVRIHDNLFKNMGLVGIWVGGEGLANDTMDHVVQHNSIDSTLLILNDAAGIFFDNCKWLVIQDNIVRNVIGEYTSTAFTYQRTRKSSGIYFNDQPISDVYLRRNTVSGCGTGINVDHRLDAGPYNVSFNTLFNNGTQIQIQDYSNYQDDSEDPNANGDGIGQPHISNDPGLNINYRPDYSDTYEGNILYSLNEEQPCMGHSYIWWPVQGAAFDTHTDFGTYTGNFYFNPFSDLPIEITSAQQSNDTMIEYITIPRALFQWQGEAAEDPTGTASPLRLNSYTLVADAAGPAADSTSFDGDLDLWEEDGCTDIGTHAGFGTGSSLFSPGTMPCEWIQNWQVPEPTAPSGDLVNYRMSFTIKASDTTALMASAFYDLTNDPPGKGILLDTTARNMTLFFTAPDPPLPGATVFPFFHHVELASGIVPTAADIFVDNVVLKKCTFTDATPLAAENHILRYNDPLGDPDDPQNVAANGGSFELIGCWMNVYGDSIAGTVELEPWTSIVLYRIETVYDIDVAEYQITTDTTWNTDMRIRGSVVVRDDATLTIDGATIGFADTRQDEEVLTNIVVLAGGTLDLINGAHLTTVPTCGANSMWNGVKVFGDTDHNAAQGAVNVLSGSRVSNSLTGILAGDGDPMHPGISGPIKNGLVHCDSAYFENNMHDVVIHGLPDGEFFLEYWDIPFFRNSQFLTTDVLNYDTLYPISHVRMANHGQVIFLGCTFANDIGEHTESKKMGHGIEAFDANFAVWPIGGDSTTSTFRNLDHAVHSTVSGVGAGASGSPYSNIVQSVFTDNICAAYLSGVPGFGVRGNLIEMGRWDLGLENYTHPDELNWNGFHRGIFTTDGFGFSIQDNTLRLSTEAVDSVQTEGIVVGYVREHDDIVYRNTAEGLERGFIGEGICASTVDSLSAGLQFQCNTNVNNATNFMGRIAEGDAFNASLHTIRARQGSYLLSAGNTFDQTGDPVQFYLNTYNASMPRIYYFYDANVSDQTPNPDYLVHAPLSQELEPTVVVDTAGSACATPGPGVIGGGEDLASLPGTLQANESEYTDLQLLYNLLIDGGDTQELLDDLVEAWYEGTYEVTEEILELSPFISSEVLTALIESEDFTDAQKAAILIANPEGAQRVMRSLPNDFPQHLIDLITASWIMEDQEINYRAQLEMQMNDYHTNMVQAANHWVHLLQTDVSPADPDTLRMVWQQVRTPAARYAEAAILLATNEHAEAETVITELATEKPLNAAELAERNRMLKYIDVLAEAAVEDRNAYQLTSLEVAVLDSMAADHYDRPSVWASNLLCAVYGICRAPYTGGGDGLMELQSLMEQPAAVPSAINPALLLQPNPASSGVTMVYSLPGNRGSAKLLVRDISGRIVQELTIGGEQGQATWTVQQVVPGVYSVELLCNGRLEGIEQLVIQR